MSLQPEETADRGQAPDWAHDAWGHRVQDEDGVDVALIREALTRIPRERLAHLRAWQRSVAWLRRARRVSH